MSCRPPEPLSRYRHAQLQCIGRQITVILDMASEILAITGALLLAVLLGISDAPNATASLIAARAGRYRSLAAWSIFWHFIGALIAGVAVAESITGLVRLHASLLIAVLGIGCMVSVVFTWITTRKGLPVSASVGLVGALAGAGIAASGFKAVNWYSVHGYRITGITPVLAGIFVAPLATVGIAALVTKVISRSDRHLSRESLKPIQKGIWAMAAWVAISDGTNDGQKAMGIMAVAVASGYSAGDVGGGHGIVISWWIKVLCGAALAVATAIGGRRIIKTVARGLYHGGPIEGVTTQAAAAAVIFGSALLGFPVSTSSVVTSGMVGAGMVKRRHHVRWREVTNVAWAWILTVPVCAIFGFVLFIGWRAVGGLR